eukprot:CAMPEP_0171094566 /NCGR_PEP_ID=MMETSP0766_2-20121228/41582_1 /TAXON_ID=439317 /ORGANISM="Gambierdiscus australes, Strain CAWD 149" /LENGTH=344 /DNA_ID=CAMNT_0011553235 /DNA_START=59 /DNA_END=1093 /DNA_ORIENTATION=+
MSIPVRPMGSQGMQASMQGYGCMGLTAFYGKPLSDEAALEVLQKAFDLGVTHYDTAEVYAAKTEDGTRIYNEEVIGKFAAKVGKDKITIATKYFPSGDKATCTAEQVREALDASLKRLGIDCVDLYYLHRVPSDEGLKSFMEAASALVKEGKCKYLGISEASPTQIRAAHAVHPLTAVQQEWSLLIRSLEAEVVPTCRELGIAVVAYSPLCRGFTSAAVKSQADWSKIGNEGGAADGFQTSCPHLSGDNVAANAKLLEPLEATAAELGVTPAQLSLAWVQSQGEDVFPIPGTTKIANLESNVGAVKLALDKAEKCKSVGESVDWAKVAGERYDEQFMQMCFEKK